MTEPKWDHADRWRTRKKDFMIEVCRWGLGLGTPYSKNVWNVYVYLYEGHRLFDRASRCNDTSDAYPLIEMHGGITYFRKHFDGNQKITSIQIGCDYAHAWDESYEEMTTKDEAGPIFHDAQQIIEFLEGAES